MTAFKLRGPRGSSIALSIRAMMVLVLICGVPLGWKANRASIQRRAVATIEQNGGQVAYDYQYPAGRPDVNGKPWGPVALRRWLGDEYFQEVVMVVFTRDIVGDCQLAELRNFDMLRHLSVLSLISNVTDDGLANLDGLNNLRELHLPDARISDAGLTKLKRNRHLQVLSLSGTQISDDGLRHLVEMRELKKLDLSDTRVTGSGLKHLTALTELRELNLSFLNIEEASLRELQNLPKLKVVRIVGTNVSDAALQEIGRNKGIYFDTGEGGQGRF